MKILALITEYNPFHNGHLYHLRLAQEITGASHTIAVMSGNFVQRGEPAIVDKWARAKMAVKSGLDLVFELPTLYASSTAELFAFGSISLLDSLNIVDSICFGSEAGDIGIISKIAHIINESPYFREILRQYMDLGLAFPVARSKAIIKYFRDMEDYTEEDLNLIGEVVKSPNNILGIEYLKALERLNSPITPYTISRKSSPYHSKKVLNSPIASATAIRDHIHTRKALANISHTMPGPIVDILLSEIEKGNGPVSSQNFEESIFTILRRGRLEDLKNIFDVVEGLENKIYQCSIRTSNLRDLYSCIKSKRYTLTRLQRIMIHILLNIDRDCISSCNHAGGPQYGRVLAFNNKGREVLRVLKNSSSIPIITNLKHYRPQNKAASKMLNLDVTSTNIYSLAFRDQSLLKPPLDYTRKPYYEKD